MRYFLIIFAVVCVLVLAIFGLQGRKSKNTPLFIFDDMDYQSKYKPMGENTTFSDSRNDRPPPAGTVARGSGLNAQAVFGADFRDVGSRNEEFITGKNSAGDFIENFPKFSLEFAGDKTLKPYVVNERTFALGKQKFAIFCAACHGVAGNGEGILKMRGSIEGDVSINTIANLQQAQFRKYPNGQIFDVIANGKNTMQPYGDKLSPAERWAVIAYLRALQLSQNCPPELVPASTRTN